MAKKDSAIPTILDEGKQALFSTQQRAFSAAQLVARTLAFLGPVVSPKKHTKLLRQAPAPRPKLQTQLRSYLLCPYYEDNCG